MASADKGLEEVPECMINFTTLWILSARDSDTVIVNVG